MDETMVPDYGLALIDYQSEIKYKDIAEKYCVTINTVKSWKVRLRREKRYVHNTRKVCRQEIKMQLAWWDWTDGE